MILTPHALAGALAGVHARRIPLAVAAGAGTHLLLDRVPHAEYSLHTLAGALVALDLLVAALIVAWTSWPSARWPLAAAGAAGAVGPDALQGAERAAGVDITLSAHIANHTSVTWPTWLGIGLQVALVCGCAAALVAMRGRRTPAS